VTATGPETAEEGLLVDPDDPKLVLLPLNICGPVSGDKIYNGKKTALFQYPWMAPIGYNMGN
jgi:hypothetical protein